MDQHRRLTIGAICHGGNAKPVTALRRHGPSRRRTRGRKDKITNNGRPAAAIVVIGAPVASAEMASRRYGAVRRPHCTTFSKRFTANRNGFGDGRFPFTSFVAFRVLTIRDAEVSANKRIKVEWHWMFWQRNSFFENGRSWFVEISDGRSS
jgi:hypothetical protein